MSDSSQAVVLAEGQSNEDEGGCVTCIVTDETLLALPKFTKTLPNSTTVSGLYDEVVNVACIASGTFLLAHIKKSDQESEETILDDSSLAKLCEISELSKRLHLCIKPKDGQVPVLTRTPGASDESGAVKNGSWKAVSTSSTSSTSSYPSVSLPTPPSYSSVASRATSRGDYAGLVNQAMTCYLNSVLQTQFMTPEFRNAIYHWQYSGGPDAEVTSIPFQLQKLFATMQTSQKRAVKTVDVTKSFGWTSADAWQQHDVQELCRVMFDALEHNFKGTAQDQLIKQLYEGTMQDYVRCLACGYESTRSDTYMDISLVIKPFGSTKTCGSVEEALQVHVTPETLEGSNQYFCEKCDSKQDAHKGLKFLTFPYLLTLQLKRFDFDYNTMQRIKLNDRMTFPASLDLTGFIAKKGSECEVVRRQSISLGTPVEHGKHFPRRPQTSTAGAGTPAGLSSVSGDATDGNATAAAAATTAATAAGAAAPAAAADGAAGAAAPAAAADGADAAAAGTEATGGTDSDDEDSNDYVYELLSIMVHSGSAIGGHYYAYIRSAETKKWYSFNDSSVTPITTDDIKKTFGGSSFSGSTYTSMYSSSANAYMLIYRRIDPKRNTKFMTTEEFPPHIARLVKAVEEQEEDERRQVEMERSHCRIPVFYRDTEDGVVVKKMLEAKHDIAFKEAIDIARRLHGLDDIPVDRCRLVKYDENYDSCECSYDGRGEEQLGHLLGGIRQTYLYDLLLETRPEDEEFEVYLPQSSTLKVYEVDIAEGSVSKRFRRCRVLLSWTVEDLMAYLEKKLGYPASTTRVVVQKYGSEMLLLQPGRSLSSEGFYRSAVIYVEHHAGHEEPPFKSSKLYRVLSQYLNTVKWHVTLPAMPVAEPDDGDKANADENGNSAATDSATQPRVVIVEFDKRGLVSDFKRHLEQYLGDAKSSEFRLFKKHSNGQENEIVRVADPMSFHHSEYELRVQFGRAIGQDEYRVTVSFFSPNDDAFMTPLGDVIIAKGMDVQAIKDRMLELTQEIVKSNAVVADASASSTADADAGGSPARSQAAGDKANDKTSSSAAGDRRHKFAAAIANSPADRVRLRRKNYKAPFTVLSGDLQVGREMMVYSGWEVAVEILPAPDNFSPNKTAIFVRQWKPSSHSFGLIEEIAVADTAIKASKEAISALSGLPVEQIEIAKAVGFFPYHYSPLNMDELNWNPKVTAIDRMPLSIVNDGAMIYYRDAKEQAEMLTAERRVEIERQEHVRSNQLSRSNASTSTGRRERALKINTGT